MNSISKSLKDIKYFVEHKFPDVYAAFLSGSAVDGHFNKESDYDIYIITNTRDFAFTESFNHLGKEFQSVHLPLNKIDEILWLDNQKRSGIYISAFAKGVILTDNNHYLKDLINHCKVLYELGPAEASYIDLHKKKIIVTNLISDLAGNNNSEEKIILSHDLYHRFINFYLDFHKRWVSGNKHLIRQLKFVNQSLSSALSAEIQRFHQDLNPEGLLNLVKNEMANIGSLKNGHSLYPGVIEVKNSYVTIFFSNIEDYYVFRLNLSNVFRSYVLNDITRMFIFRGRPLGDIEESKEGIFLVIDSTSMDYANKEILPSLKKDLDPVYIINNKAHFPVNFDFSIFFGGDILLKHVFTLFSYISNEFSRNLTNPQHSISLALRFAKIFKSVIFTDSEWIGFLEFVNLSWISRAYDNKKLHSISAIIAAKENLLNIFSIQYTTHKEPLEQLFNISGNSVEDKGLISQIKLLSISVRKHIKVNKYQNHPITSRAGTPINPDWVVYKNIFDYAFSILLVQENQKSYLIYILNKLSSPSDILQ